jgi:uncharacterized protein (TIGR03083 family)
MLDADHLAALVAANAVLGATDPATLDRPVPACPDWDVEALLEHISQVQRWATRIVEAPPGVKVPRRVDEAPTGPAIIDFFTTGADALVAALTTVDLDHDVYSFVGTRPARWWLRRQAHETVIHAWDRQDATREAGPPDPIAAEVAIDGIGELLEVFLDARLVDTTGFAPEGETLHVHATDIDGEWMVRIAPGSIEVTPERGKGDLALRGPAADLLLALWSRRPADAAPIEAFGSLDLLTRIRAVAPF